jgi:hypothetical protein
MKERQGDIFSLRRFLLAALEKFVGIMRDVKHFWKTGLRLNPTKRKSSNRIGSNSGSGNVRKSIVGTKW